MNKILHVGTIVTISLCTTLFIFSTIALVPSVRTYVSKIVSMNLQNSTATIPTKLVPPQVAAAIFASGTTSIPVPYIPTASTGAPGFFINIPNPSYVPTRMYDYKIMDNVDECTLNTLGAKGFNAVQFGGTISYGGGRDGDCGPTRIVKLLDWVLFAREKDVTE